MARIEINKDRCKGCYLCIVNCPNSLIKIGSELNAKGVKPAVFSEGKPVHDKSASGKPDKCTGCAMCAMICPEFIIKVYK